MRSKTSRKAYDIDGVINLDELGVGIRPNSREDFIITGRSFEEEKETLKFLHDNGIMNKVFFNQLPYEQKTRASSGVHKGMTLNMLRDNGHIIEVFYEDDEIQIEQIKKLCPWISIIHVQSDLVEKENKRR